MSESAKKAHSTRAKKRIGSKVAQYRNKLAFGVKDILARWNVDLEGKKACAVCADCVPLTILQVHHLNPNEKNGDKIFLCASCHNIFNKSKLTTQQSDVERDLQLRHKRFNYNIGQM